MTLDNRLFIKSLRCSLIWRGEGMGGEGMGGKGEEGSKIIFAQNRPLRFSATNLIGLTIIYFVPHFWGLIWAGPRFLIRNLCKFQNFGVNCNVKQILDVRMTFEKNVHSKIHFQGIIF